MSLVHEQHRIERFQKEEEKRRRRQEKKKKKTGTVGTNRRPNCSWARRLILRPII